MFDFIFDNALLIVGILAALLVLAIVIFVAVIVKKNNKWREKEFESNRDNEMLKVRIGELEKEAAELHEHEAQLLSERDSILTAAHEKADDILEQTMTRVQKSEAQIRQNRIIASGCITDARRRISDLMLEMSKRLVIEDGMVLDVEQVTPEAVKEAEAQEQASAVDFDRLVDAYSRGVVAEEPDDEEAAEGADEARPVEEPAAAPEDDEDPSHPGEV